MQPANRMFQRPGRIIVLHLSCLATMHDGRRDDENGYPAGLCLEPAAHRVDHRGRRGGLLDVRGLADMI